MRASVQKWGNSLAVRIPKALAVESKLKQGCSVELSSEDGKIVLVPQRRRKYSLKKLLGVVNRRNLHAELDFGKPVGREAW